MWEGSINLKAMNVDFTVVTDQQLIKAFNRWMDEYKADPETFMSIAESMSDATYGEKCTAYFKSIL